ncbi:Fungal lipase-like domain containing protein [Trema orientale]|uniref:Phospholipase A1 n=1 Tax=Trema orientale TaxID=63057 RepID=A0A2P5FL58_TREOI|nr:Fungal lipase-like domain containing protein [Trema orientale]
MMSVPKSAAEKSTSLGGEPRCTPSGRVTLKSSISSLSTLCYQQKPIPRRQWIMRPNSTQAFSQFTTPKEEAQATWVTGPESNSGSAFNLVANGISDIPIAAVIFNCPKVGNQAFKNLVDQHRNLKILHVLSADDPADGSCKVVALPQTALVASRLPQFGVGVTCGGRVERAWLTALTNPFELKVKRSFVLVNKWTGTLLNSYGIPKSWWLKKKELMEYKESTQEWVVQRLPKTG